MPVLNAGPRRQRAGVRNETGLQHRLHFCLDLALASARNQPFLAIFNYWRGQHEGGGQWAVTPSLYPFGTLGPAYHP